MREGSEEDQTLISSAKQFEVASPQHGLFTSPSSSLTYEAEVMLSKQPHTKFEVTSPKHGGLCSPSDSRPAAAEVTLSSSSKSKVPHTQSEVTSHLHGELLSPLDRPVTTAEVSIPSLANTVLRLRGGAGLDERTKGM